MKKVYICSRFRPDENHSVDDNIRRALYACEIAITKGYAPFAPHLIYPRFLDDDEPNERTLGMEAGKAWLAACDELWQWGASVSEGMAEEITFARTLGIPVKVFNSIGIPKDRWNGERLKNGEDGGGNAL